MPVNKEIPRKKTKPASSRKTSVGKIIHQNHNGKDQKEKENSMLTLNTKPKNKEKAYKDIIKEKLLDDKYPEKVLGLITPVHPKSRTDRRK